MQPSASVIRSSPAPFRPAPWALACVLLGLVQVGWAGYRFGVGNQTIQVAFLLHRYDPSLFTGDAMVHMTLAAYPSFFFRLLAVALRVVDVEPLYLSLHVLTAVGLFLAVFALTRRAFGRPWAGLTAGLFLLAGHHQALAEQTLYSTGFTHTWAVLPLAVAALALFYANRPAAALLLAGLICNFHALEGGQLGLVLGFWALCNVPRLGWRRVTGMFALFALAASPAAVLLLRQHQTFGAQWIELMRLRSGHNSFPSTWWQPGRTAVPRFAAFVALAALAFSLSPAGPHRRKTLFLAAGVAGLFVAGILLTDVYPFPLVIRAQLFRASRFALLLALVYIAAGCVQGWSLPFRRPTGMARWRALLEFASATLVAACVALPSWLNLLPLALVAMTLTALVNGRLHWFPAALAGVALVVCLAAWQSLQFDLPGITSAVPFASLRVLRGFSPEAGLGVLAALFLGWSAGRTWPRAARLAIGGAATVLTAGLLCAGFPRWLHPAPADPAWADVQRWARAATPRDALFLTPAEADGFRMLSRRSIVGEWRDGTQLYFSADFTGPWWQRMNDLLPGLRPAPDGRRLLVRGRSLSALDDEHLLALATRYHATHIVVAADTPRKLEKAYANARWAVYLPELAPPPPPGDARAAQEAFLRDVVRPGLEQHRTREVHLRLAGAGGRPLYDTQYRVEQVRSTFRLGVSLPPFEPAPTNTAAAGDFRPAPATEAQLRAVKELANYTVLTYDAWWSSVEPVDGEERFAALDRAVDWCANNHLAVELSFLAGFPPAWLKALPPAQQQARLTQHALALVERYGPRVAYWQVSDQGVFADALPELIALLRKRYPGIVLGLGEAARFYSPLEEPQDEQDMQRGLDEVRALKDGGTPVDFVSLHGDRPWGLWADARTVHRVLDAYAAQGVRIHISAFEVPAAGWIEGAVRRGHWDEQLQAQYVARFCAVAAAHPAVDAIDYAELGPDARMPGGGLLGADGRAKPAYAALRDLAAKPWRTTVHGTVPLDGRLAFRGFLGSYELELRSAGGATAQATFDVTAGATNEYRFLLDAAGHLTREEAPVDPATGTP